MSLADQLTVLRILLAFVLMYVLLQPGWVYPIVGLLIFILASLTDLWDGQIARARGTTSDFGRMMDPIADKVLVLSCFFVFLELKLIVAWMVMAVVIRELLVTGLRFLAASKGVVLPADRLGKHKTFSQTIAIIIILVFIVGRALDERFRWLAPEKVYEFSEIAIFVVMLVTVALTLSSGIRYFIKNWRLIAHEAPVDTTG